MESIQVSNPYLRNAPSCRRFQSTIQFSINWSVRMLFAIATVVAEVLTLHAYSQGTDHDFVINLTNADIRRSRFNRRKFIVKSGSRIFNIFCNNTEDANVWALILARSSSRRFSDFYRLGKQIADGRHSKVYLAHAKNGRSAKYIVKVNNRVAECNGYIFRSQYERDAHLQLIADFDVRQRYSREKKIDLEERKHRERKLSLFLQKIVILRDSFGTPTEDFLVFPYQDGEILSTAISKYGPLSEWEARFVMWDLLTALHFMHEKGVVHRDVCASNIFYWNENGKVRARLFDLSEAREILDDISGEEPFRDNPGRHKYKALEILSGQYHGKSADIWSCGVLLYRMLSGCLPFQGESEQEVCENIKCATGSSSLFAAPVWDNVSPEAVLLIKQMLHPDPFTRPSALGARSHEWLSDETVFRQHRKDDSSHDTRKHVPVRLQTPTSGRLTRASSAYDRTLLPAVFYLEEDSEEFHGHKLCMMKNSQSEVVSSTNELPPIGLQKGDHNSYCSPEDTTADAEEGDASEDGSSGSGVSERQVVSFVTSVAHTLWFDRLGTVAATVSDKLTKLQATFNFKSRNQVEREDTPETASDVDLEASLKNTQFTKQDSDSDQETEKVMRTSSESSAARRLPDRKRKSSERFSHPGVATDGLSHAMLPVRPRHALTHRCNHLCALRPCTRSVLITRAEKLLKLQAASKLRRSVAPYSFKLEFESQSCSVSSNGNDRLISRAPDRALCVRQQQRVGSTSEFMPITRCLDEDVFLWAIKTKLFSDLELKLAPSDPLFYIRSSNSTERSSRWKEKNFLSTPSSFWKHSPSAVPLRDEMCTGTTIMQSVVAAAHVGLPQFTKSRPAAAKLLLGSPTAQLHLAMILPYRRKFRTAGLVLMAMFRMISLKKGSCLTRRVARGQPLPEELLTLLTDIRRKCHMRPLQARMPNLLPPDTYAAATAWRKERAEPRPTIPATRQRFWSRQWEVKKGMVISAWKFVKDGAKKVSNTVRHGRSQEDTGERESCKREGSGGQREDANIENNGRNEAGILRKHWRCRRRQRRS